MKEEKTSINEASENKELSDMPDIAKIMNIKSDDVRTIMRKKKIYFIIGAILVMVAMLTGCISPNPGGGGHYMAICIKDFSWIWRFF